MSIVPGRALMRPLRPELFIAVSSVADHHGHGPAVIHWTIEGRPAPPYAYPVLINAHAALPTAERQRAEAAVQSLLTRWEATTLRAFLARHHPAWSARLHFGRVSLPMEADEAVILLEQQPASGEATDWFIRLPPVASQALAPVSVVGFAAPWPWPELSPGDIARLVSLQDRLGSTTGSAARQR